MLVANKAEGSAGEAGMLEAYSLGLRRADAAQRRAWRGHRRPVRAAAAAISNAPTRRTKRTRTRKARRAAQARHRRPAQRRQVDADQPHARRGAADHRARGRDHPRFDRDRLGVDTDGERPVRLIDTAGMRKKAKVAGQAREAVGRRCAPRGRFRRGRRAAARRARGARGAGPQDRRPGAAGGPRADHRDQQMGRRRGPAARCSTASARRSTKGWRRRRACRCSPSRRATGKGLDQLLAAAFEMRETWSQRVSDRRAQPLVRRGGRAQSAAGAGRQADQAALHHPGRDPPADLRAVRHAARPAAGELSALSGQRHAPGTRLRRGADPPAGARPSNPFAS